MQLPPSAVAVVTGAASGLGEATARRFHEGGATVVLMDLPSSDGAALAAAWGERVHFVAADVRDGDQVDAALAVAAGLGEVRVAVACAGTATPGRLLGRRGPLPTDAFRTVVDVNVLGSFHLLRAAAATMAELEPVDGDRGVVVLTSSIAAYDGQVGQVAYAASKGAVASMTLAAARDLAATAVRVVTIAPGVFETPMMSGLGDDVKASLEALVPHPARLGKPDEYAALVGHIVDNPLLNGEVIRLDGALRMPAR